MTDIQDGVSPLSALLRAVRQARPLPPLPDVVAWRAATAPVLAAWPRSSERALCAGAHADRLGLAFAGGYQAALESLQWPGLPPGPCSLLITEADGGHPRAIQATLTACDGGYLLTGDKSFATLATVAEHGLVVARIGVDAHDRPRLRAAWVDLREPGIAVTALPEVAFAPEIPHARVSFTGVHVRGEQVADVDAYTALVKPFRTVEDLHVTIAAIGYLLGVCARVGLAAEHSEALWSLYVGLAALSEAPPLDAAVHLALGGAAPLLDGRVQRLQSDWVAAVGSDDQEWQRWQRDGALFHVAGRARATRLRKAREALGLA